MSPHDRRISAILESPGFRAAMQALEADHERSIEETVRLARIPAPPFNEDARAELVLRMMNEHGLHEVRRDPEGNVIGLRKGRMREAVVVSAHMDTVFPAGTDLTVRREGDRIFCPGIGDDTRGLGAMFALLRALDAAGVETEADIVFLATVGEEGLGNLRGVRHFFSAQDRAVRAFMTIDGPVEAGMLMTSATGSRRYRLTVEGPGGHSFFDFGAANPLSAVGAVMAGLAAFDVPAQPRTTFNCGVVSGGTVVNAIPSSATLEVDLRSEGPAELAQLDARFRELVQQCVAAENARRKAGTRELTFDLTLTGDRPAAAGNPDSDLTLCNAAALRAVGFTPVPQSASCDASIPMALGIPAALLGWGEGDGMHTVNEWLDASWTSARPHLTAALATVFAAAGVGGN